MMKLWHVVFKDEEFFVEAPAFQRALEDARDALSDVDGFDHSREEPLSVSLVHDGPVVRAHE